MESFQISQLFFCLIVSLCLHLPINCQQACITFYEDISQQGNHFQMCSSGNIPAEWNDQVSSFAVPQYSSIRLYRDANYQGQSIGSFTEGFYDIPSNYNDQLSSVIIYNEAFKAQDPIETKPQAKNQSCPTFYNQSNQHGDHFQRCYSGDVFDKWQRQVRSFMVPFGYSIKLHLDPDSGGRILGPYQQGYYNIPADYESQISYITIDPAKKVKCPTFYTDIDQQGDSFQMCSTGYTPEEWYNQVSSFYIPNGFTILLFKERVIDINNCYVTESQDLGTYSQGFYNVPGNFNDLVDYVHFFQTPPKHQAQASIKAFKCPVFFKNINRQGANFQLCSSGNVPKQWETQISSFYVPANYVVQLYQNFGYGGQNIGSYNQGWYNVPGNYNDQVSSVVVLQTKAKSEPKAKIVAKLKTKSQVKSKVWPKAKTKTKTKSENKVQHKAENCPTFYQNTGKQGDSFQLCSSGNVPKGWSNQVSSFYVPVGYFVRLYQESNYGGQNIGSYMQGSYDVPSNYNDHVGSLVIARS